MATVGFPAGEPAVTEEQVPVRVRDGATAPVRPPTVGAFAQVLLLTILAAGPGLGTAGWLAGAAYTLVLWVLLTGVRHRAGERQWGPADTVTLARAVLAGGVVALAADTLAGQPPGVVLAALAAVALALDAVDGQVARRTGTASRWGARFDMETDAVLVLALSVVVAGLLGWWVLLVGTPRYAFGAAARVWPWLRAPLPPSRSRKVVAATQGVVLVVVSAGVLPVPLAAGGVVLTVLLLAWSFGRDITWLRRLRVAGQPVA